MAKRLKLATRALGAEPGIPDVPVLTTWISDHRGIRADITTYLLDISLSPQLSAGIMSPCAGGKFYRERILACLSGVDAGKATDEISLNPLDITQDDAEIASQKKGIWCALPAPHILGITDAFYDDEEEWADALAGVYHSLMRSMRDTGISGHVLICNTLEEAEVTSLVRQNVFFYITEPVSGDLEFLLEHQPQIAVGRDQLDTLLDLTGEYDLQKVILVEPDDLSISRALSFLDPDKIIAGGYCTASCQSYWNKIVSHAEVLLE
jgi:hypothetical protein